MTIGEVVQQYPSVIPILLEAGVHCIGCHVSAWESLEDGFRGHGMQEERIDHILSQLNEAVEDEVYGEDIKMTELAAEKLKEILQQQKKEGCGLRIEVVPGGCSGMQYSFSLTKEPSKGDEVLDLNEVKVFMNKESFELLKGSKIDYVESLQDAGFRIHNPNAKSNCGCGKSFG